MQVGESGRKMFYGSYEHCLDDKNRLVIPSKMRCFVSSKLFILKGFDGCLSLYTENNFNAYLAKLSSFPFESKLSRDLQRIALSTVFELEVDKVSRIQIPTALVNKYGVTKEVVIVGMLDHIEIWSKNSWENYVNDNEKEFEAKSEELLKNNG